MYSILPSDRHIRLLWVFPELDPGQKIKCTLQIADLDSYPLFDCLSYTWINPLGLAESSEEVRKEKHNPLGEQILCDGEPFAVSRNLLQCLQFFRQKGLHVRSADGTASSSTRPIWIDAICINQGGEEKPKQILMMSNIYARAHQVLIWLGPGDEHSGPATSVINRLASIAKGVSGLQYYDLDTEDPCPKLGIEPSISPNEWYSYATLLQRAWFSRVWVAQETYFAKSIVVFSGETEVIWKNLVKSARVLQETGLAEALQNMMRSNMDFEALITGNPVDSPSLEPNTPPFESFSPLKSSLNNQLILTVFGSEERRVSFSLDRLLSYSCYLDAGLPLDKVFGLIGIWQDSVADKNLENLIPVDYNSSVSDVFMNATYAAMREMEGLNLLRLVGPTLSTQFELPSWVPDYTCWPHIHNITTPKIPSIIDVGGIGDTISRGESWVLRPNLGAEAHCTWRADGGRAWHIPILEPQSKCLTTKGNLFETVADVGPSYRQVDSGHELHLLLKHLGECPTWPSPYGMKSSMVWLQTLVAGKYRNRPADHEAIQAFHDLIAVFVKELEEAWQFSDLEELPGARDIEKLFEHTKSAIDDLSARQSNHGIIPTWEKVRQLIEISLRDLDDAEKRRMDSDTDAMRLSFDRAYGGRRIFRTTGNYWGISSESLKEGDQVCVLSGADTPYVLRKSDRGWRVIGEAYVHGIMHGEAAHGSFEDLRLI